MDVEKIVFIEWIDSVKADTEWEYIDEAPPLFPATCYSVGMVWEETEEYITIIETKSDNQIMGRLTIPKPSIRKIFNLVDCSLVEERTVKDKNNDNV